MAQETQANAEKAGNGMKKNILLRTNLLICMVIIAGFLMTAVLSYRANYSASLENIEQVSTLTSEGIYYQMNSAFTKPVNISLTMANDSLLKEFLATEAEHLANKEYIETIRRYLGGYQNKYNYDSVFWVSTESGRYYNFNGLDRVLEKGDPENDWYFEILDGTEDYSMNVDNDEVIGADNEITVFVNCKIKSDSGGTIGVVGVGVRISYLQDLLQGYQDEFGVNAYLINENGTIEISTDYTGFEAVSLFDIGRYRQYGGQVQNDILGWKEEGMAKSFWVGENIKGRSDYIVTRYLPELGWHLVVERDTSSYITKLNKQLALTMLVIAVIIGVILYIITQVIRSFNRRIIALTESVEQERHTMFEKATEQLFDKIYELDITKNRPANQATAQYFEKMGAPKGTPYDQALQIVAERQIHEAYREGYVETFKPESVLRAYEDGRDTLRYDFMILNEEGRYYWMRITARIVKWESDGSIHMLTYRQNIDAEKQQERRLHELAQTDEMTGLLTKTATERQIEEALKRNPEKLYAFFITDIDSFKQANDLYGHSFGDTVIVSFARTIQQHFREDDIAGRFGGDEFVVFASIPGKEWAVEKAAELSRDLCWMHQVGNDRWQITASIGVAVLQGADFEMFYKNADAALYESKKNGRNRYTMYYKEAE